jgi:hypothetical protein
MGRRGYIVATAGVIAVFVFASLFERRTQGWCDAISGSKKWRTTWPFGITTGTRTETSGLERRLREIGYQWNPEWRSIHFTATSLLGGRRIECSTAPPILEITSVLDSYARSASPDELRRFADVLQSGNEQEQNAAIQAAGEKGLAAMAAKRPGG